MLNQVVLVGRLAHEIQINNSDSGKKVATLTLAIPRSFKNMEGGYDTDFIKCIIWDSVAENTKEYCKKGDVVGLKGRLQSRTIEKDKKNETIIEVVGEKITFLSSKPKDENEADK